MTLLTETILGDTPTGVTVTVARTDTGATLVTAAAMTTAGGGVWTYAIADPAPGLSYFCTIVFAFVDGGTFTRVRTIASAAATVADGLPRYLSVARSLVLAPSMLGLAPYLAAAAPVQSAALAAATMDIDTALRYQGRRVDVLNQVTEFPRVAYEARGGGLDTSYGFIGPVASNGLPGGNTVWDWDPVAQVPVIPSRVERATIHQANSRLDPVRIAELARLEAGLSSQKIGSAAETYDLAMMRAASGGSFTLCREAAALMEFYVIRQGRIL